MSFIRLPEWAFSVLAVAALTGCASEPFYNAAPLVPQNVSPLEEADIVTNANTSFVWNASANAQFYEFHIFNQQTKAIDQYYRYDLRDHAVCNAGKCSVSMSVNLPAVQDHAWRVRAGNNAGFSAWSRTRFNMVAAGSATIAIPAVPDPLQPLTGSAIKANAMVDFVWRAVPEATSYEFHLFDSVNRTIVGSLRDIPANTVCQGSRNCQITRKINLPPSQDHAWRVRAINNSGESAWTRVVFAIEP